MTDRKPVLISHPGCDCEPLRCFTCTHAKPYTQHTGRDDLRECEQFGDTKYSHDHCRFWTCRKCGGEVTT